MKATFFERVLSYAIDTIIISFIFSIICLGAGSYTTNTEKLMKELDDKLVEKEITPEEYLEEYSPLLYDYQKENALQSGISVALTIAYVVVFQYMNKGQTIGKKVFKIQVVDKDTKKPISILKGLLRSFIVYSILSSIACLAVLFIVNAKTYLNIYMTLLFLEGIFTITTVMFILYKKDGRGLHDIMANTMVIKESR